MANEASSTPLPAFLQRRTLLRGAAALITASLATAPMATAAAENTSLETRFDEERSRLVLAAFVTSASPKTLRLFARRCLDELQLSSASVQAMNQLEKLADYLDAKNRRCLGEVTS